MDEVISQAPDNISKEEIEVIFKKNNENVINTLIDLWNLDVPKSKKVDESSEANIDFNNHPDKWANIRDICDSYDLEMQTQMNRLKQSRLNQTK
jgi:hypothetical protein